MEEEVLFKVELNQGAAFTNLERFKKGIIETKQEQTQLNKAFKDGNVTLDEYVAESVRLEQVLKKETQAYNQLTKQVQGHESQTDKLIKSNKELAASNNKISDGFQGMAGNINVAGTNLGGLTSGITQSINPFVLAGSAVSALAAAYFSTGRGAKDLETIQIRLQATTEVLSNKVADLVDKFKSPESSIGKFGRALIDTNPLIQLLRVQFNLLLGDTEKEIDGLVKVKEALKDLELAELDAQKVAKVALDQSEQRRQIRDDDTKSEEERLKAAKEVQGFVEVREQVLLNLQRERLENLNKLFAVDKKNKNLQREIKQVTLEIADIQEDSQGKRTEAINGIRALNKEIAESNKIKKEEAEVEERILRNQQMEIDMSQDVIDSDRTIAEAQAANNELISGSIANMTLNTEGLSKAIQNKVAANEKEIKSTTAAAKADKDRTTGLMILSQALGGVATLFKESTIANKVFSAAQAGINSFLAGTQVLRDEKLPTFAKIPAMIAIVASGLAQQAKILGAFADGGLVPGFASGGALSGTRINSSHGRPIRRSNGDNLLATVKTGEVILNERQQAALGGSRTFRAIGVPGFADGGNTSLTASSIARSSESRSASNELFAAISQMKFAVSVEDINEGQTRVDVIESMATFG